MKITFAKGALDTAPKGYVRVRLTEESKGTKRQVREDGIEWLEIGIGKRSEVSRRKFIIICRTVVMAAKQQKAKKIAIQLSASSLPHLNDIPLPELGSLIAQNLEMASFEFRTFKTKPKEGWSELEEVLVCGDMPKAMQEGFKRGQMIGQAVNATRELSNTPGGSMTPRGLAKAAKDAVKGLPVTVETLGRAQIERLGMGLLAGVGAGSPNEPTFTILTYKGLATAKSRPIVLAGKGITFDSGGLNLKPSSGIYEMHMDMSGAASVIHAVALAARLKLKQDVIGLIPAAENMLGHNATRPGDIHRSLSGKTVEILNTDAEGRLVLADALTYAKRFTPSVVIDVATLTGAAVSALGLHASALLTRDDALAERLLEKSETSGDYLWRLPLWEEYDDMIKSSFADMANIGASRYGGATEGGIFLLQFANDLGCPWAHIDIAPRMTAVVGEELAKGAAGAPVRLLIAFIESWKA